MYGTLLEVAAYTAAVDGNRRVAKELIGEAESTADPPRQRCEPPVHRFGPANVTCTRSVSPKSWATAERPSNTLRNCASGNTDRRAARPVLDRRRPRLPPVGQTRTTAIAPCSKQSVRHPLRFATGRLSTALPRTSSDPTASNLCEAWPPSLTHGAKRLRCYARAVARLSASAGRRRSPGTRPRRSHRSGHSAARALPARCPPRRPGRKPA